MKKLAILAAGAVALPATAHAASSSSSDAARAVETASRGVNAKPYDLDRERNRWEVQFADGTERHVSLDGRRVLRTRRDDDRSSRVSQAKIGLADAIRRAARRASGTVTEADLDRERGKLVWSVTFERGDRETEVDVDIRSGRVLRVTHDDD
ncbi:MAG TPA: PepSY domain-containing protein [Solirubrobacter sp.]|nr:PepSY domain-containing protein [Solirubrobacter sp.]